MGKMDDALTNIRLSYPAVKGVSFDQLFYRNDKDWVEFGRYIPDHTQDTISVVRNHFSNKYFIGSII
jgi:hypothetical protein